MDMKSYYMFTFIARWSPWEVTITPRPAVIAIKHAVEIITGEAAAGISFIWRFGSLSVVLGCLVFCHDGFLEDFLTQQIQQIEATLQGFISFP